MSRSCHSATFSSAACALPRSTRARPGDLLALDRVALVRHRRGALLAGAERLLHLAHLGALQVADLGREAAPGPAPASAIAPSSSAWRSRATTCVETSSRARPSRASTRASNSGLGRRVGADRARERADRRPARTRARRRSRVAVRLEGEARELDAERRRLGVHAVRAPDAQRVARARARARRAPRRARARPATITSPAARSCSASAVSSTSEEVRPKWIQRPASPGRGARARRRTRPRRGR